MSNSASKEEGSTQIGMHTLRPFLVEYALMSELCEVHRRSIPGVYVIPSATSPLVWFGMLIVRSGCYVGGLFKFILIMPEGHPHVGDCPAVVFQPPVFHPLVDMVTGAMNCTARFPKWTAQSNSIAELLEFVKDSFYQVQTEGSVNPEAGLLCSRNPASFQQRAGESVQFCRSRLLDTLAATRSTSGDISEDTDPHTFPTFLIEGALLEESKRSMMSQGELAANERSSSQHSHLGDSVPASDSSSVASGDSVAVERRRTRPGLSWVKPGTAVPFSRELSDK